MNSKSDFWAWLWGDWGKPNPLTRAGIPRIMTNLATYILLPYLCFILMEKSVAISEKRTIRTLVHHWPFLAAYCTLYVSLISSWFLQFRYSLNNSHPRERFQFLMREWRDTYVKVNMLSLAITLLLILYGAFHLRRQPG